RRFGSVNGRSPDEETRVSLCSGIIFRIKAMSNSGSLLALAKKLAGRLIPIPRSAETGGWSRLISERDSQGGHSQGLRRMWPRLGGVSDLRNQITRRAS